MKGLLILVCLPSSCLVWLRAQVRADYKLIAKALTRKGSALAQLGRLEEAVTVFNKSLTEHRNPDTLKKLNDTEKQLKDKREKDYINMDLCAEEREKGNQVRQGKEEGGGCFVAGSWLGSRGHIQVCADLVAPLLQLQFVTRPRNLLMHKTNHMLLLLPGVQGHEVPRGGTVLQRGA